MEPIINSRQDLNALKGTPAYREAMERLKGSMTTLVDVAVREGDTTDEIEPIWVEHETLASIERLGFSRQEFLDEYEAMSAA